MPDPSSFQQSKLKLYRKACSQPLSQEKLAELIHRNPNTIYDWEKNGVVKAEALLQLARLFKDYGVLSSYKDALRFWEDCRREPYPPPAELRALFGEAGPHDQVVESTGADVVIRSPPGDVSVTDEHPTDPLIPRTSGAADAVLSSDSRRWPKQRWQILLGIAVLILVLVIAFWRMQPWVIQRTATAIGLGVLARCDGQTEEAGWYWDQGSSDESRCIAQGGTITVVAGGDTVQDPNQQQRRTAPLLLHPVTGDFTLSVRLEYDPGLTKCRHAGIGLRIPGNDSTWVRVTKTSNSFAILSEGMVEGRTRRSLLTQEELPVVTDPIVYLRIERRGTIVSTSSSTDGQQWRPHTIFEDLPLSATAEAFLLNYSACNAPRQVATFSEVVLTSP
jgi:DNA-binding XRE family transcriptional regulator